ncbi:MAG: Eco57I restriction-modification methylase domain-containing protein [Verrucomicrobiota bacterium]
MSNFRPSVGNVIDFGAGDGRFALKGKFTSYLGIEIDKSNHKRQLPRNATIEYGCAFEAKSNDWDISIGNPPYVRNHYIELPWMEKIAHRFKKSLDISINRQANLFVYFLLLGIESTKEDGLVAMLTPYEWVTRPSSKPLRELIKKNRWSVHVYRFKDEVFTEVMTTSAITIIDKSSNSGEWCFYLIDKKYNIKKTRLASGSRCKVLDYTQRDLAWAQRGLSPGTQKVFTLTEGERIHNGLSHNDVHPCVTTLKHMPSHIKTLDNKTFKKYYRDNGHKCWLIKSYEDNLSSKLADYLESMLPYQYNTSTCNERDVWFKYKPFEEPNILFGSGFTKFGPKVLINSIRAHNVGSVYGVFTPKGTVRKLTDQLKAYNFEERVISHSGNLKKVEVRQLNSVLQKLIKDCCE